MEDKVKKKILRYAEIQKPFWIRQYYNKQKQTKWIESGSDEFNEMVRVGNGNIPNHRLVLKNELVFDFDAEHKILNKKGMEHICTDLDRYGWSYSVWDTGSKGYHIKLFFDELLPLEPEERVEVKKWLIDFFVADKFFVFNNKRYYLKDMLDFGKSGEKTLISMEWASHWKSRQPMIRIKKTKRGDNKIPEEIWKLYENYKVMMEELRIKKEKYYEENKKLFKGKTYNCIEFFETGQITDCRKRILFALVNHYKTKMEIGTLRRVMHDYNSSRLNNYFTKKEIDGMVDYHFTRKWYTGCKYRRLLLVELNKKDICFGCPKFVPTDK